MLGMLAYPYKMTYVSAIGAFNAAFPASNLGNNDYGRVAKTTSAAVGQVSVNFDLGAARDVDVIAVLWHNLRATDTIQVMASNVAAGNSEVYASANITAITGVSNRETSPPGKFLLTLGAPVTARYWRVNLIVVGTALPAGFVQASRFMVGKRTYFQIGPQQAEFSAIDLNQKVTLDTGDDRVSEDTLLIRPIAQLNIAYAKETEMADVVAKYTMGLGVSLPMMVVPDLTAAYLQDQIIFGRPEQIISVQSDTYDVWKFNARVRSLGP